MRHAYLADLPENTLTYSERFVNTVGWVATSGLTPTQNVDTAPDGNPTADELDDISASDSATIYQNESAAFDPAEQWCVSVFVKKNSNGRATQFSSLEITFLGSTTEENECRFDTKTGEFDFSINQNSDNVSAGVLDYGDYWRVYITALSNDAANTSLRLTIYPARGASSTWNGSVTTTGTIIVWGAQVNRGTFPAPYIGTVEAAVDNTSSFIQIDPGYDYKNNAKKIESRHRARDGSEFIYKWGQIESFKFSLSFVNSATACQVNSWWGANTPLIYQEDAHVSSVYLVNQAAPIAELIKPYRDQFKGKIELGSY